jgi:hypothetical protein
MKQISIVEEDRPNLIADLIEVVSGAGVTIETLDSEVVNGLVVAILTVDEYDTALAALARAGLHGVSEDALLVRIDDHPGALAALAHRFKQANLPLRSVRFVRRLDGQGIVALSTARTDEALELVRDVLIA